MSWSHSIHGKAEAVRHHLQLESEKVQSTLGEPEKSIHARVVGLIDSTLESNTGNGVSVDASGHGVAPGKHNKGYQQVKVDIRTFNFVELPEKKDPEPVQNFDAGGQQTDQST